MNNKLLDYVIKKKLNQKSKNLKANIYNEIAQNKCRKCLLITYEGIS